ncbi:36.4 kDa proline-rich protein [Andrographis paniculata]|uniref:36.4 kDa proline-rich protein n=1 Tax=Andrographis paniculata TaxID=175694 RepID=UPI0021E88AED|nr:36.4 kDa proline-rich protein [Andrographis paniculata]
MNSSSIFALLLLLAAAAIAANPEPDCGPCSHPPIVKPPGGGLPKLPLPPVAGLPKLPLPPVGLPPVGGLPKLPIPPVGGLPKLPLPPVGLPPVGGLPKLPIPPVGGLPKLPLPPVGGLPKLPLPPVGLPPVGGLPKLPLPPVGGLPKLPLPPVVVGGNPPKSKLPCPSPAAATCPINALKLGACVDLLGGAVHIGVGNPAENKCCPIISGLAEVEAALCLCTTIKLNALNIKLSVPIALQLLISCGKTPPPGFTCAF